MANNDRLKRDSGTNSANSRGFFTVRTSEKAGRSKSCARKTARGAMSLLLGLAIALGLFSELGTPASADVGSSLFVDPLQAFEQEKPDVWIETSIVLESETNAVPTGYVELALKARTPTIYFYDAEMTKPIDPAADGNFNPDDPSTYEASRQTTFRSLAVTLQYNTDLLVPVSWDHEIERDATTQAITNAYPDFYAKYYVSDAESKDASTIISEFQQTKNEGQISVPVLQYSTDAVSSAIAYAGGPNGLLSFSINAAQDTVLPEESGTPLAVVRFLYVGSTPIEQLLNGKEVDETKVASGHDRKNASNEGDLRDFFWFAEEDYLGSSVVTQALLYESGRYQEDISVDSAVRSGINQFYSTKTIYNGDEVPLPASVAKYSGGASSMNYKKVKYPDESGAEIDCPLTEGTTVVAKKEDASGYNSYSYTTNLLFTSAYNTAFETYSHLCFSLRAAATYRSTGGGTAEDYCAIVFYDWDDTVLGAVVAPKGDARDTVEKYVEKFIHPSLRKSTALASGDSEFIKNLATSLDRKYNYAGNHASDYAELSGYMSGGKSYSEAEAAMAADVDCLGKTIFPDGYEQGGVDYAGSSYPLTNKLDYAFMRRPVDWANTKTYYGADSPYTDDQGKNIDATEWITGVIDYDGSTSDTNDDYWYIHGWAVVDKPANVSNVWTTFSTYGELSSAKLPGYDSDTVEPGGSKYDGINYFNIDRIRAADGADIPAHISVGGSVSNDGSGKSISFATYGESSYFEFADFSEVTESEMYVKACYEPCEQLAWADHYTVVSEPHYVRYGINASDDGGVYSISFDYERINNQGNGVRRIRDPWTNVQYTIDDGASTEEILGVVESVQPGQSYRREGTNFYVGMQVRSDDIMTAEFTPTSAILSLNYSVVEVYTYGNFVASLRRSTFGNEAGVLDNFNYNTGAGTEGWENGYTYENRKGTQGYVFRSTLNQILEEATDLFDELGDAWESSTGESGTGTGFNNEYLTAKTLMDLNLRLGDGKLADGSESSDLYAYITEDLPNAQAAIYDALKIGYKYKGNKEVIDLDWHQIQYHIIYHQDGSGSIDTGSGVRSVSQCGSFAWCRLDGCSETVTVSVSTLEELLTAIEIAENADNSEERRNAAKAAIAESAADVLTKSMIYKSRTDELGEEIKEYEKLTKYVAADFSSYEGSKVIKSLVKLVETATLSDDADMLKKQVQKWLMTYDDTGQTGQYEFYDDEADSGSDTYTYWWFQWDKKPEAISFALSDEVTTDGVVARLVQAADEYGAEGRKRNPLAWDDLSMDRIKEMRFRNSAIGDFFDKSAETYFEEHGVEYLTDITGNLKYEWTVTIEYDWSRDRILKDITDIEAFQELVTEYVTKARAEYIDRDSVFADEYAWERLQYYILNKSLLSNADYDKYVYYSGTENGQYWWEPVHVNIRFDDVVRYIDDSGNYIARPTNATMQDLQTKLSSYKASTYNATQFSIWFCQETAADLVLKRSQSGTEIEAYSTQGMASRLLEFADAYSDKGGDCSEVCWSQAQYYLIFQDAEYVKGAQSFTYGEKANGDALCPWGDNAWREDKRDSITELGALIKAIGDSDPGSSADIDTSANTLIDKGVERLDDLEIADLYFKIGKGDTTNVADVKGNAPVTLAGVKSLIEMKRAYETQTGGNWNDLAAPENLDSAWYLIQYYLYNNSFVAPSGSDSLLDATAAEGRTRYWWKDGWSWTEGKSTCADLQSAAYSGVSARLDWIEKNAESVDSYFLYNLRTESAETRAAWSEIISAAKTLGESGVGKNHSFIVWWKYLQFMILHKDNTALTADAAVALAVDEYSKFYWWYMNGSGTAIDMPSPEEDSKDWRAGVASAIMEAELRVLAADDSVSGAIVEGDLLAENLAKINIRVPNPDVSKRDGLLRYGHSDNLTEGYDPTHSATELRSAIDALIKQVYEDSVAPPDGVDASTWSYSADKWDYVTDAGVFTYNKAAYDAVCALTPYQIQHWLVTYLDGDESTAPSYTITDADGATTYWWIDNTDAPKGISADGLKSMLVTIFAYGQAGRAADVETLGLITAEQWADYGFSVSLSASLGYFTSTRVTNFLKQSTFCWEQVQYFLQSRSHTVVTAESARNQKLTKTVPEELKNKDFTITAEVVNAVTLIPSS